MAWRSRHPLPVRLALCLALLGATVARPAFAELEPGPATTCSLPVRAGSRVGRALQTAALSLRQACRQARLIGRDPERGGLEKLRLATAAVSGSLGLRRARPVLLYQGAFDPVHRGHLTNLRSALAGVRGACEVYVVPTSEHPGKHPAAFSDRVAMLRDAVEKADLPAGVKVTVVDDARLARLSATGFDELTRMIHGRHPGAPLYIVTGADAFASATEKGLVSLARRWGYRYAVTARAGSTLPEKVPVGVEVMPLSGGRESSTLIREDLARGKQTAAARRDLLSSTLRYIEAHGLYGASRTRVVGLTGGIASGKSTVSRMLAELGAKIVDADLLAREIVEPERPALREIVRAFGREVLRADGTLDRKRLGAIVFSDPAKLEQLNRITHPRIARLAAERIAAHRAAGAPLVIYDAALLVEKGWNRGLDGLVVVSVPERVQLERLKGRDGITEAAARARLASQAPLSTKLALADHVIDNSGSLEQTRAQVQRLWQQLTGPDRR